MEETEIEDYFADYFAKLSHTLARCGNEWYNHNKVYAGGLFRITVYGNY